MPGSRAAFAKASILAAFLFAFSLAGAAAGQTFTEYATPTAGSGPGGIVTGPDGNLWFTETSASKVGRITPAGAITEFSLPSTGTPTSITVGSDGNLWFGDNSLPGIGRITTAGVITMFPLPSTSGPADITAGPDGALWFADNKANQIGRITTAGAASFFSIPTAGSSPAGIVKGADNNLWFTEFLGGKIGKITTAGLVTEFLLPTGVGPGLITNGPDGNLWFTDPVSSKVGKITTAGAATMFTVPTGGTPVGIAPGPDGNLWFTDNGGGLIERITLTGTVTTFTIPTSGSGPVVIIRGPDNAMWFTENGAARIGRITVPSGSTPNLTISKSAPATIASGQNLTYTITYGNTGSGGATGVSIRDTIPSGTTFVSATGGGTAASGVVTWNVGTVNAGATGTVSFTVMVTATSGAVTNSSFSIQGTGIPAVAGAPIATSVTAGGGGLPNLTPYQPTNWSDKIVVARTTGGTTDTALTSADTLHVSWAIINNGTAATSARFFTELYVDGILRSNWYSDPPLLAPDTQFSYYVYVTDFSIGSLPAGTHTLRIKADSTNAIPETNESDNEYTKTITISGPTAPCVNSATTVCLNGGRFAVTINWQSPTASGTGTMVPLTSDTAAVWFFSASNLEMMFKVVNGCGFNSSYWVFAGGLTNVNVTVRVTDTQTGTVKTYVNPLNTAFLPIQDTSAFRCP
ncbi:MAG: hypothetical protein M3167_06635 [Acidobacteriota bacterium]|nr:hypothetical protein [Acidobacteriota bacterium]